MLKKLALDEENINATYHLRSSSAAKADARAQEEAKALSQAEPFERFAKHCAATGAREQIAVLVESRAISGLTKIRTNVNGNDAEVWTTAHYLMPTPN
jgi:hypothetical protein